MKTLTIPRKKEKSSMEKIVTSSIYFMKSIRNGKKN